MKILMLCWEYPPRFSGGLGIVCRDLSETLASKGHEVHVLLPRITNHKSENGVTMVDASKTSPNDYLAFYSDHDSKTLSELGVGRAIAPYLPPKYFLSRRKKSEDSELSSLIKDIPLTGDYSAAIFMEMKLYALIAEFQASKGNYDIVHAHDWMTLPAARLIQNSGHKVVSHIHSTEIDRNAGWANREVMDIEKQGLKNLKNILVVSAQQLGKLKKDYGIDPTKITILPNGFNKEKSGKKKSSKNFTVGFLGRFAEQKAPSKFVDIARQLKNRVSELQFSMVGEGHLEDQVNANIHRLNMGSSVQLHGFMEHEKAMKWLLGIDLLLVPSGSEPFGLVALEAVRRKVPVVISKGAGICESIPELLQSDPWDIHQFTNLAVTLIQNQEFRERYTNDCLKSSEKLSWKDLVSRFESYYQNVVNG